MVQTSNMMFIPLDLLYRVDVECPTPTRYDSNLLVQNPHFHQEFFSCGLIRTNTLAATAGGGGGGAFLIF